VEKLSKFIDLGIDTDALSAIEKKGFEEPTKIQEQIIPLLLQSNINIIGQAQTGTGKTAAFGLPLIMKLFPDNKNIQALILTPTRELAIQVAEEINSLQFSKKLKIAPIYGGQSIGFQIKKLKEGLDIVVGTPGRIIDHLNRKSISFKNISYLILDEADEMLNMGFFEDVEIILNKTNPEKRILLFSATIPKEIHNLAVKHMGDFHTIKIQKNELTVTLTDQIYFEVNESDRFEALCRIIDIEPDFYGLIFCRTKIDVDNVSNRLISRGYDSEGLHGDISQAMRERILSKFKKRYINILVATDVAARGIDISDLSHVINYSIPQNPDRYIHRIGRTGRAGKGGTAITFITPEEYRKLMFIKRIAKTQIRKEKLPEIIDIINQKKEQIKEELYQIIIDGVREDYLDFAREILSENTDIEIVSALLKYSFQNELEESSYSKIKDVSIDKKGKTRLFIALGKNDGMTPKKIVDLIKKKAKTHDQKIKNVSVHNDFSFISVPFREAEIILKCFKQSKKGSRPIVELAKKEKK